MVIDVGKVGRRGVVELCDILHSVGHLYQGRKGRRGVAEYVWR